MKADITYYGDDQDNSQYYEICYIDWVHSNFSFLLKCTWLLIFICIMHCFVKTHFQEKSTINLHKIITL